MTLNTYQTDQLFSNKIGVPVAGTDLTPNPYMREKLLGAIKSLLKTTKHTGQIQVYTHCYEIASLQSKPLKDIKKELEYELATRKVMLEESKTSTSEYDYIYYQNQVKSFENVLNLVEQQIDKDVK